MNLGETKFPLTAGLRWVAIAIGMIAIPTADASLIGDDVRLQADFRGRVLYDTTAVGDASAVEFTSILSGSGTANNVDILDDHTIQISFLTGIGPAGFFERNFTFSDVDWGGAGTVIGLANFVFSGVASQLAGFDLLSPTSFRLNDVRMRATRAEPLATLTFDVVSSHDTVIPEPSTYLLLASGVGLLVLRQRRA